MKFKIFREIKKMKKRFGEFKKSPYICKTKLINIIKLKTMNTITNIASYEYYYEGERTNSVRRILSMS